MTRVERHGSTALGLARRSGPLAGRGLAAAGGAGALSAACAIGLLATSGWLLTRASQRPPVFDLALAVGAVQAFALGRGIARYLQRLAVHGLSLTTLSRLRLWLFDTVEPLVPDGLAPPGAGSERPAVPATGSVLSGFVAGTEEVTEALAKGITTAIDLGASILLGAAVALLLAPTAAAALLAGAAGGIALAMLVARLGRSAAARTSALRADLADQVVETMRSAPELLAFGRADLMEERLEQVRRHGRSAALRQSLVTGIVRALTTWAAGAGLLGVVLAGLSAHRGGRLSGIMLTVLVLVALAALDQASGLPAALAGRTAGDAAATRLAALSALETPVREPAVDAGPALGSVGAALEHVDVVGRGGPPGPPLLSDVSLAVRPGWRLGLIGPSGAGKSSALHVLLHFLEPSAGTGSIGGVDVRRMTRTGMARHLAWLAEETHLFAAPLGDNLRLASPEASDLECVAALDRVGLGAWYRALPDGLGTDLGAGGRAVSAGERQRLGMARAVLSGASLLLLDEPTSHLDPWSSPQVLAELLGAAGSRTIVVVSHEPGLAGQVHEIVSLDRGRVVAHRPGTAALPGEPGRFASGASPV
jgi:thiol reductant ABC exporter CydC subunit